MLAGLDPSVILYMPCDGTQDDLLHQLPWYRGYFVKQASLTSMGNAEFLFCAFHKFIEKNYDDKSLWHRCRKTALNWKGSIVKVLFKIKQLFKNTTQRSALRLGSYEWQGVGDSMGKETPTKKGNEDEVDEAGYSEAGPSREQEEEEAELINEAVTTRSLSLSEL
ncbi:hypothetical protein QYF61_012066 [Mycteria americana]|uniref:Uncharacterized protein n=1 Tax=Mycteria americana TaxID=33587 RepID=A0AAN7RV86_MYCAM|nr:hypothetical protein QYF61_012066 [Mycteria americana]